MSRAGRRADEAAMLCSLATLRQGSKPYKLFCIVEAFRQRNKNPLVASPWAAYPLTPLGMRQVLSLRKLSLALAWTVLQQLQYSPLLSDASLPYKHICEPGLAVTPGLPIPWQQGLLTWIMSVTLTPQNDVLGYSFCHW